MVHSTKSFIRLSFIIVLSLLVLSMVPEAQCASPQAKASESVAILPLTIHAAKDLSYLQDGIGNMLASRLAANAGVTIIGKAQIEKAMADLGITDAGSTPAASLKKAGTRLGADYLITGSLTALGSSMSLDARVLKTAGDSESQNFYATAASEDEVLLTVNQLVWDITAKVFGKGKPAAPAQPAAAAAQAPAMTSYQTPHPDRAFMYPAGGDGTNSAIIRPIGMSGAMGFTKSQNFRMELRAMDLGDVDGDGINDVVLADRSQVTVYKRAGNRFQQIAQIPVKRKKYSIHALYLADLNNNGRAEIYVSAADQKEPNSFALEWNGKSFDYLFSAAPWYIRTLVLADHRTILAGQQADFNAPLKPGIHELKPGVAPQIVQKLRVPATVNLFDFAMADLDKDGAAEIIAIDQYSRIKVMRQDGRVLWISDEDFGGTTRFLGEAVLEKNNLITKSAEALERTYIPGRIIVSDMNQDGQPDIIVNKNLSATSAVFKNLKSYTSGEIYALTWNGIALAELWHTRKISGQIADYQLVADKNNPKKAELLVGVGLRTGMLDMSESESTVLMYQLDSQETEN